MGGSGRSLDGFWEILGRFWEDFLCQDPRAVSRSPAERPNARGSPTPQRVENATSPTSLLNLPWEGLRPLLRRLRVSRRLFGPSPFGGVLGHFFAFFSICFAFFAHLKSASLFLSIFIDFLLILEGFGVDLGRILAGFFDDFSHAS